MMTLNLWSAIRGPRNDQHPLFRRILFAPRRPFPMNYRILGGVGVLVGLFLLCTLSYFLPQALLAPFSLLPFVIPVLFIAMVIGGTGHGLRLAFAVSKAISRERHADTFNILGTLREGKIGIYWLILTAHVHREGNLESANEFQQQLITFVFFASSFVLLILYLNTWTDAVLRVFINSLFVVYPLIAIYYIDYVCSIVTGAMCGAILGALDIPPREAGALAAFTFLGLQGIAGGITYVAVTSWLPALASWLSLGIWASRFSIAGFSVLLFFLIRELSVYSLWHTLVQRVGASPADVQEIIS